MAKIKTKILVCALAASMAFSSAAVIPPAEAAVSVAKTSDTAGKKTTVTIPDWRKNSAAAASIEKYVKKVTNKNSKSYIPVNDRIAVFDLDGTIIGELYPSYFEYMMFIHRALYDETYQAPADMKQFATALEEGIATGKMPENNERLHAKYAGMAYSGMTTNQLKSYTKKFMKSKADGFTNLTRGDAFYKPMVSLVRYLTENDFTCYIVSGSDRTVVRAIIQGTLPIKTNHVIGMSYSMVATGQGDTDGLDYVYSKDDNVVLGGDLLIKTIKMNKVSAISQEIGKVPVLSFGNSSGDVSMAQYVENNSKYEGRAYMVLCDDLKREHGNMEKADAMRATCEQRGFDTISMRKDFKTIYDDDVKVTNYEYNH
ncbi:MAG: haloacid dehalogenase-like hydrolase [Lachnospiraceae bacterium]|nr:haloacid dehalogenase-like hydrolase [Lachnospiraceae bacterium]